MPVSVSDILKLPDSLKLLLGFAILMGAQIQLPVFNIAVGEILFFPILFVIRFFVPITWIQFSILYAFILLLIFIGWIIRFVSITKTK